MFMTVINVTIINSIGSPITTQIEGQHILEGLGVIKEYIERGQQPRYSSDLPIVAAYLYCNRAKQLRQYVVDALGRIREVCPTDFAVGTHL